MNERRDQGFSDFEDEAIDLALVHADDEYLDLLSDADLDNEDLGFEDDQLTQLLMSWRKDVDAEPVDDLVDRKLASVTVYAARMRRKRRPRLLVPIAAAAAVLAIAFAGIGLAARDAQPGDTLWALSKVLYAERARSVEAAEMVRADLRQARDALTEGDIEEAKSLLADANAALPTVLPDNGRNELEAQHKSLLAQLPGNPADQAGSPPVPTPSTQQTNPGSTGGSTTDESPSGSQTDASPSTPPEDTSETTEQSSSSSPTSPRNENGTSGSGETGGGTTNGSNGTNGTNGINEEPVDAPATVDS